MPHPAAVPFPGRARGAEVLVNLVLAGLGVVLIAAVSPALSGREPIAIWLLVVYTAYAVAVTVLLAVAAALTSRLPVLTDREVDAHSAAVLRAWGPPWWHTCALDLGLAALGLALGAAGLAAGGAWAVFGAAPAALGLWYAGRVALVPLGRRRRPALWLTDGEVVVDSPAGRGRAPRTAVRAVRARGRRLVVDLDQDAAGEWCPRPWRRTTPARRVLVFDAGDVGHRPSDLETWLSGELGVDGAFRPGVPGQEGKRR